MYLNFIYYPKFLKFPIIFEHCSCISCYLEPKYDRLTPFRDNHVYYLLALLYSRVVTKFFIFSAAECPQEKDGNKAIAGRLDGLTSKFSSLSDMRLTYAGKHDHLPVLLDVGSDLDIVEFLFEVEDVGVVGGDVRGGRCRRRWDGIVRRGMWKFHSLGRHIV